MSNNLPIAFPFTDPLALRLANLVTQDMEKIEKAALGTQTPWNTRFPRPYKAHYANDLAQRIKGHGGARDIVLDMLPAFESQAQSYIDNPRQRGRPLTQFISTNGTITDEAARLRSEAIKKFRANTPQASAEGAEYEARMAREVRAMFDRGEVSGAFAEALQRAQQGQARTPQPIGRNPPRIPVTTSTARAEGAPLAPSSETVTEAMRAMERIAEGLDKPKPLPIKPDKRDTKEDLQREMSGEGQNEKQTPPEHWERRAREIAREEDREVLHAVEGAVNPVFARIDAEIDKLKKAQKISVEVVLPGLPEPIPMGVQHEAFPLLVKTVPHFPVWLPGPAGSGKTTAARHCARALGVSFHHHGAVDNVYQLLGFIDAGGAYHRTSFREAYECGGVFLWDEVDASNPAALVAFNAAIENGECVFPDMTVHKHAQCYFIAAANTYGSGATHEYVGRTKLDAATVDRFVMIDWNYDEKLERMIAGDTPWTTYVQKIRQAVKSAGLKHLVTPRASIRGNTLLKAGLAAKTVIDMTVRKGLAEDQWMNIKNRVPEYR